MLWLISVFISYCVIASDGPQPTVLKEANGDVLVEKANVLIANAEKQGFQPYILMDKSESDGYFILVLSFRDKPIEGLRMTHTTDIGNFRQGRSFMNTGFKQCFEMKGTTHCFGTLFGSL